jgi:hypothetical protein
MPSDRQTNDCIDPISSRVSVNNQTDRQIITIIILSPSITKTIFLCYSLVLVSAKIVRNKPPLQAQVSDSVQEWKDVGSGFLHGEDHDPPVLFSIVREDRDDEVSVERVEVPGGLIRQKYNCKYRARVHGISF